MELIIALFNVSAVIVGIWGATSLAHFVIDEIDKAMKDTPPEPPKAKEKPQQREIVIDVAAFWDAFHNWFPVVFTLKLPDPEKPKRKRKNDELITVDGERLEIVDADESIGLFDDNQQPGISPVHSYGHMVE